MSGKKYELTEETKTLLGGIVLHRILAVKDFTTTYGVKISAGELGGWIEDERNLSQEGVAWIYGEACVYGDACVYGEARVCGDACVCGEACVYGDAWIYGEARVCGDACVCGEACVYGEARVGGEAIVSGNVEIGGHAVIKDNSDYSVYKNTWSSMRWVTYTRSDRMWKAGCFRGTGEELIAKAYEDGELSGRCYEAIVRAQESIDAAKKEGGAK